MIAVSDGRLQSGHIGIWAENIAEFEARMREYHTNGAFREKIKGYADLWTTGSREILEIL